ncbi:MAG: alpha/beta fold hydrolase BchO [Pseudomonadota bacterium]
MFSFLTNPDWETDGAAWPHRASSRFVDAGDYRWHVQRMGKGPTLALIHGTGAATHSWAGLAPLLAQSFDVVAFDLPGHGFTQSKRWSPPSLRHVAKEVGLLLDALDAAPDLVVGHSAGAAIMIRMATDKLIAPSTAVSINGALSPFGGAAAVIFPAMAKLLYYNPFAALAFAQGARSEKRVERLVEQTGSTVPDEYVQCYRALMRRPGHVAGALGMMAHWDLAEMDQRLAALTFPCMFVAGAGDKAVPPGESERVAALAPRGRSAVLPDLGHLAHEEAPAVIAQIIAEVASSADIR